jgi:hypothetical protein
MELTKKKYKNILDHNGDFAKDGNGNYIMEMVEVPLSPEAITKNEIDRLQNKLQTEISIINKHQWIINKQDWLNLTDDEIYAKHGTQIDEWYAAYETIQALQESLRSLGVEC